MRCRPLTRKERQQGSHVITRTIDEKVNVRTTLFLAGSEQSCLLGEAAKDHAAWLERQLPAVEPQLRPLHGYVCPA